MTLYPARLSLVSKASCRYFANFLSCFVAIFCCCGQAISQIQIFFFSLSSSIKSGLLAVVVFRSLNSKSQTSFPCSFSSTAPHSHCSLYQITSLPISSYSLAQLTAIIISALLCRAKYIKQQYVPQFRLSRDKLCIAYLGPILLIPSMILSPPSAPASS